MPNYIEALVKGWADDDMSAVNLKVAYLETRLFRHYEPNKFIKGEFWERCEEWLKNVNSDEAKKTLYRLLTQLLFVGPAEFDELFRCASLVHTSIFSRWLADRENIDVCTKDAQLSLLKAAQDTWFCPITDSFQINSFFHINNLPANANLRPDWCSLHILGDVAEIKNYCTTQSIKRLVLLEDFVGGGSQSLAAVKFAASLGTGIEVLFVPMIICPDGANSARLLETQLNAVNKGTLSFEPVLELPPQAFFTANESSFSVEDTQALRNVIDASYPDVSGGRPSDEKPYDKYGYPPEKPTGGLVVMYTNTPDNTLPLIHWRPSSGSWQPVFPRHSRV